MLCPQCIQVVKETDLICPYCQTPLKEVQESEAIPLVGPNDEKLIFLILAGLIGLFSPIAGIIVYLFSKKEKPKSSKILLVTSLISLFFTLLVPFIVWYLNFLQ